MDSASGHHDASRSTPCSSGVTNTEWLALTHDLNTVDSCQSLVAVRTCLRCRSVSFATRRRWLRSRRIVNARTASITFRRGHGSRTSVAGGLQAPSITVRCQSPFAQAPQIAAATPVHRCWWRRAPGRPRGPCPAASANRPRRPPSTALVSMPTPSRSTSLEHACTSFTLPRTRFQTRDPTSRLHENSP
jgi:hypothetical protein